MGTHRQDDGRFRGHLVGHVEVHADLGRVGAEAGDLLELGGGGQLEGGRKAEQGSEEHGFDGGDGGLPGEKCLGVHVPRGLVGALASGRRYGGPKDGVLILVVRSD